MNDKESFDQSFAILKKNAETLRKRNEESDDVLKIDDLVPLVEQSAAAYAVATRRIEAIRRAVDQKLGPRKEDGTGEAEESGAPKEGGEGTGPDEEIPF